MTTARRNSRTRDRIGGEPACPRPGTLGRAVGRGLLLVVVGLACACSPPVDAGRRDGGDGGGGDGGGEDGGCSPRGSTRCEGDTVLRCGDDGTWQTEALCDPDAGEVCAEDHCSTLCERAESSYLGCEYFPTVTVNSGLDAEHFDFAVVVANPGSIPAELTVERLGERVVGSTLGPHEVRAISLPWIPSLQASRWSSALEVGGAYRMVASVPVAAYQFNPLRHATAAEDLYSFTNDASLLLPRGALGTRYVVVAYPTEHPAALLDWPPEIWAHAGALSGFVTVVAADDDTEVTIRFSAHTQAGPEGSSLTSFSPGDENRFLLDRGDVLQLLSGQDFPIDVEARCFDEISDPDRCAGFGRTDYCVAGRDYDLTGTTIDADKPVAVFVGSDCANIPYHRMACDHLEDQLLPLSTWGRSAFGVSTEPQVDDEPNLWRVVSAADGNSISFTPDSAHPAVTLDAGGFVEFVYQGAFMVSGTDRLLLAQFMVGEDYAGIDPARPCVQPPPEVGDPSMGLCPPAEQYRSSYDFLTPDTFTRSFVNVIAPDDAVVTLDGERVPELTAVAGTGFGWVRIEVEPGAHHMESEAPEDGSQPPRFGIMVSGIARYTSYLYPGGLDLVPIY